MLYSILCSTQRIKYIIEYQKAFKGYFKRMKGDRTMNNFCELAIEILRNTNDGDDLEPRDLKITEMAVNGHLNEAGEEYFKELHRKVIAGQYIKPYLLRTEYFTRDYEGFIYYKGIQVEHYDSDYAYSEKGIEALKELERRCKYLESKDIPVNGSNVIWQWEEISGEHKEPEYLRNLIQKITKEFNINGCCDIAYMCNVVAFECGIGNGSGKYFTYEEVKKINIEEDKILKAAKRLCGCYAIKFEFVFETLKELKGMI